MPIQLERTEHTHDVPAQDLKGRQQHLPEGRCHHVDRTPEAAPHVGHPGCHLAGLVHALHLAQRDAVDGVLEVEQEQPAPMAAVIDVGLLLHRLRHEEASVVQSVDKKVWQIELYVPTSHNCLLTAPPKKNSFDRIRRKH